MRRSPFFRYPEKRVSKPVRVWWRLPYLPTLDRLVAARARGNQGQVLARF